MNCMIIFQTNKIMEFFLYFLGFLVLLHLFKKFLLPIKRLPPSPWGLPLIGHLHLIGRMPHHSFQKLSKKFGDIMFLKLGMIPAIVISSPALAKEVFKTHDSTFSFRPYLLVGEYISYNFKGIALSSGDHWKNMRKICTTELFTVKRIDSFLWVRLEELSYLMSSLAQACKDRSVVNVREHFTVLTFNIQTRILMSRRFFGENLTNDELAEAKVFKEVIDDAVKFAFQFHISEFVPSWLRWIDWNIPVAKRHGAKQGEFLQKIIDEHKSSRKSRPTMDFMDILLEHRGDDEEVVKGTLIEILGAGTDTTACTSEWALLELLDNPEIMRKAQEELEAVVGRGHAVSESDFPKLKYLEAIVKETFRLHPPTPLLIPRMSTQDCVLAQSYDVPKGATTIVNVYAFGRDPSVWENPTKFWPERFLGLAIDVKGQDFELIPFGAGRRICPGMSLGLKTVYLILGNLLHGFNWHRLPGKSYNFDDTFGAVTWPKSPLEVGVTSRKATE